MSFGKKMLALATAGAVTTSLLMIAVIWIQRREVGAIVLQDTDARSAETCIRIADQLHETLALVDRVETEHVATALALTFDALSSRDLTLDDETAPWQAVNQFDNSIHEVELPRLMLDGQWLGQNNDPAVPSPFVDEIGHSAKGACTIFQRVNEQGDMLRVSTGVIGKDGRRAVGTFIPAVQPDGTPNPVVSALMAGERFLGRAYVVDSWWITGYQPLVDADGRIMGSVFYGRPQRTLTEVRQHILDLTLGDTGYVYVLRGSGDGRGEYVVSKDGARDGENICDAQDANGRYFIREVVSTAKSTTDGKAEIVEYSWRNDGDVAARDKISAVKYFKPWDWVIGVSAYKDEFRKAAAAIDGGMNTMSMTAIITGFSVTCAVALASLMVVRKMMKPLLAVDATSRRVAEASTQLAAAAQELSHGAQTSASGLEETAASLEQMTATVRQNADNAEQANQLARSSRQTAEQGGAIVAEAVEAMVDIDRSSRQIADIITTIDEIAFQTNLLALNAAVEAARAGEQGRGFAVVAGEVRCLAQRSATAAREIKVLIEDSVKRVRKGSDLVGKSGVILETIVASVKRVTDIVAEIAVASREQTGGIEQINRAVTQLDQVTQMSTAQTEEMDATASQLAKHSQQLQNVVSRFNLRTERLRAEAAWQPARSSSGASAKPSRRPEPNWIDGRSATELALVGAGAGGPPLEDF